MSADAAVNGSPESTARSMGWVPKEEFRGAEDKWIDAETFVERGKQVLPILRKNNEKLVHDQQTTSAQVARLSAELEAAKNDLATFQEFHNEEVTRRVEATKRDLLARIKEAKTAGDTDTETDLVDQLTDLKSAENRAKEAGTKEKKTEVQQQQIISNPENDAWLARNPWYDKDAPRTFEALALAHRIKQENPALAGRAFYDMLDDRLAGDNGVRASKVEGTRGGSTRGNTGERTYADLPADAKASCDKFAKKFVNPNGRFKTVAEYRKHYVEELVKTGAFE